MKKRRANRLINAAYLCRDAITSRFLPPRKPHIVIACMPKTASTFLATALAELPGMHQATLVPAWEQREQELCQIQLSRYNRRKYVAQCHLRHSRATEFYGAKYGVTFAVLIRNLADCAISLRDHLRTDPEPVPYAWFGDIQKNLPDAEFEEAIVRLAIPWYINFYAGWRNSGIATLYDYDDITADTAGVMRDILARAGTSVSDDLIDEALARAIASTKIRFNVGRPGRGRELSPRGKEALRRMLDFYPEFAGDALFVKTRASLDDKTDVGRSATLNQKNII